MKKYICVLLTVLTVVSMVFSTMAATSERGVPVYTYAGKHIPVALGQPKLTDAQIDALIAANDPHQLRDAISTVADAVNYLYRAHFGVAETNTAANLYYDNHRGSDPWSYGMSAVQTMQRRLANCTSSSNVFHYLLNGDYDEVGYIVMLGHCMNYIKTGGMYYVLDAANFIWKEDGWSKNFQMSFSNAPFCASSLKEIADSYVANGYTDYFASYTTSGDALPQYRIGETTSWRYPTGSNVTAYYGDAGCEEVPRYLYDGTYLNNDFYLTGELVLREDQWDFTRKGN